MKIMDSVKKAIVIKVVKLFIKYVVPVVLGWLEGDSHALQDLLISLLDLV